MDTVLVLDRISTQEHVLEIVSDIGRYTRELSTLELKARSRGVGIVQYRRCTCKLNEEDRSQSSK